MNYALIYKLLFIVLLSPSPSSIMLDEPPNNIVMTLYTKNLYLSNLIYNYLSIVDIPIVVSSKTSSKTFTVSRLVSIVILLSRAQRRIATPSS